MAIQPHLQRYIELVREWAPRLDLVSPGDLERFEERHIEDSLRLAPLVDEAPSGPCADVGSGAGLPGIPLAIARPQRRWHLIEPRQRRAAFLEEVVRELGLGCEIVPATAAGAAADLRFASAHALVVGRAVAPPPETFELILPLVAKGGMAAVYVGEGASIPAIAEVWQEGIAIVRR